MNQNITSCPFCLSQISPKKYIEHYKNQHSEIKNKEVKPLIIQRTDSGIVYCPLCVQKFASFKDFRKHYNLVHLEGFIKVSVSTPDDKFEKNLISQIEKEFASSGKFKCPFCDDYFKKSFINSHLNETHKTKITYRDICIGKNVKTFMSNSKDLIPSPEKNKYSDSVICLKCNKIMPSDEYEEHYKTQHEEQYKKALAKLLENTYVGYYGLVCPNHSKNVPPHKTLYYSGRFKLKDDTKTPKFYCYTCDKYYISTADIQKNEIKTKSGKVIFNIKNLFSKEIQNVINKQNTTNKNNKAKPIARVEETKNPTIEDKNQSLAYQKYRVHKVEHKDIYTFVLYVYDSLKNVKCGNSISHKQESVTIVTEGNAGRPVTFNAFYCSKCNKYYKTKKGIDMDFPANNYPIIKLALCGTGDVFLKDESELHLYGYSVKADGMSERERQNLLANILTFNFMSKMQIMAILNHLINYNGKNKNMALAVSKWEADLDFVENYNLDNQRKVYIKDMNYIYHGKKY